jgi:hypothetical protein
MQAGYAHQMGVKQVNQKKAGTGDVKRPVGGGKIFTVRFGGKCVHPAHRHDKIPYRHIRTAPVSFQQKAEHPYPKKNKIKVNRNPGRNKGDFFVKRVIHPAYRNKAGKQGGAELAKEKIIDNPDDASDNFRPY